MAYDRDSTTLHLTPDGWSYDDDRPANAVETWRRDVDQASGWSREYVDWTCEWANPDIPREKRDEIRNQYRERMGKPGREGDRITSIGEPLP